MERRRETEGIETLNSLLNQKVNWKSGSLDSLLKQIEMRREEGGGAGANVSGESETEDDKGRRTEEMSMGREQRRSLLPFPGSQVFIFSICKRGLHYPEFNRSRQSCGCIKVRQIRQRIGGRDEVGAQIM